MTRRDLALVVLLSWALTVGFALLSLTASSADGIGITIGATAQALFSAVITCVFLAPRRAAGWMLAALVVYTGVMYLLAPGLSGRADARRDDLLVHPLHDSDSGWLRLGSGARASRVVCFAALQLALRQRRRSLPRRAARALVRAG